MVFFGTLLDTYTDGSLAAVLHQPLARVVCVMASVVCLFLAGPAMLVSAYFFFCALQNVRPERRLLLHLLAPISDFLPQLYTEEGNRHRKRFLLALSAFLLLMSVPLICKVLGQSAP